MPTTENTDRIRTAPDGTRWLDLPTRGLRRGTVVRHHGMVLLVMAEPTLSTMHEHRYGGCYYVKCLVLNPTDPNADDLALRLCDRTDDGALIWSLQGNDLATWAVYADSARSYTWHPRERPGVDVGSLLEAERSGTGPSAGYLIVDNAITLADAVRVFGKVTEMQHDVPVVVDAPCAGVGTGYWNCDVAGGCSDCRALATEADDTDQLAAWRG